MRKYLIPGAVGALFFVLLYAWVKPVALEISPPAYAAQKGDRIFAETISEMNAKAPEKFPAKSLQPADVKVLLDNGHGSGVHIGNGYFWTAGHVVANTSKKHLLKLNDDSVRPFEVLWINKSRDIALLKASGEGIETAPMTCIPASVGDTVILKGNPVFMEFVTATGKIAGKARKMALWDNVQIVDAAILPGQSGGPAYNIKGELIGITVGVATFGQGFTASPTGYGMIVPANTLCELLARV